MAGVVGSNPTRPTIISTTPVDSSKLLGPLQKTEAALQFWQQFHQYLLQRMTPKTANIPEYPQIAEHITQAIDQVYNGTNDPNEALDEAATKSAKAMGW